MNLIACQISVTADYTKTFSSGAVMGTLYTVLKFVHILIAILALGTSAGLGIVLEFYGQHPKHGPFVLGAITRISIWLVLPGYLAILATGLWMTHLVWTPVPGWLQTAMAVWCVGLMILIADLAVLRKQVRWRKSRISQQRKTRNEILPHRRRIAGRTAVFRHRVTPQVAK